MVVISGRSVSRENSALHMREASSGQRTVMDSVAAETVIGPGCTPEMSAGTMAAMPTKGRKKIRHRMATPPPGLHLIPVGVVGRGRAPVDPAESILDAGESEAERWSISARHGGLLLS